MPVERDYHDVYLLISAVPDALLADFGRAEHEVRARGMDAIEQLAAGNEATAAPG